MNLHFNEFFWRCARSALFLAAIRGFGNESETGDLALASSPQTTVQTPINFDPTYVDLVECEPPALVTIAENLISTRVESSHHVSSDSGYTINYNTVSMIEYIKFASKICNVNFLFQEADLQFTVTVVSDVPATSENVMATLLQILRVNGLTLLEQGNNLVIHRSPSVRQLATLVFDGQESSAPLITRVFRLKNAPPEAVAAIVRPMVSDGALLEVYAATRQLIITDVAANIDKIAALIENLDAPYTPLELRQFEAKHNEPERLVNLALQIMSPLIQGNPFILVPQISTNRIFSVSTPELNDRLHAVLTNLDTAPKPAITSQNRIGSENLLFIKLSYKSGDEVLSSLKKALKQLQNRGPVDSDLLDAVQGAKWLSESNTILFVAGPESGAKLREFIGAIDVPAQSSMVGASFFLFTPQNRTVEEVATSIQEIAKSLAKTKGADEAFLSLLRSMQVNASTHSILFSGDASLFPKARELLSMADGSTCSKAPSICNDFLVYAIQQASADQLSTALRAFGQNLAKSETEREVVESIKGMRYIPETHSLLFVGPQEVLRRIEELAKQFDTGIARQAQSRFLIYKPKNQTGEQLLHSLHEVSGQLKSSHLPEAEGALHAIESARWIPDTNSLIFAGDPGALQRIEEILGTIDLADSRQTFIVYRIQHVSRDQTEEYLNELKTQLKPQVDADLIRTLKSMQWIEASHSFIFNGAEKSLARLKELLLAFDTPSTASLQAPRSDYLLYKPQRVSPSELHQSLKDLTENLEAAHLADPELLSALRSMQVVEKTRALIFTGTPAALQKVEALIQQTDLGNSTAIQHVGPSTFLLYKIKQANWIQLSSALRAMTEDLTKTKAADPEFLETLQSMRYIKETNSLIFTGPEEALSKIQALVEQFDVKGMGATTPNENASSFFLYRVKVLTPDSLQHMLSNFADDLQMSGLNDPEFFAAIHSMRQVEHTQSLVFTGSPKALARIKELLGEFDISANLPSGPNLGPVSALQEIDNTSFLIYKLQFHRGDEIQNALRQIAKDLLAVNAAVNQNLLNAITSIQWLQVTNSLLCSGDPATLTRLRELIQNLDAPLKQVFIEVLIIQTSLTNASNFGLEWGSKLKYKTNFSASINNFGPASTSSNTTPSQNTSWENALAGTGGTGAPAPSSMSFIPNFFDVSVIGDIIMHNGQSFLSLGSLLNALQSEAETSVVMTPKIFAQDGKTSSIFVGQNVPYAGSLIANQSSNATVQTANFEYRDVGFNLTITPVLGSADIVTLDINIDSSTQVQGTTTSTLITFPQLASASGVTTDRTTMQTKAHVPNRSFLILSGMVRNGSTKSKQGIPCLGGLPAIGAALSQNNILDDYRSVIIFMRPTIVASVEEMKELTAQQEEMFRDQQRTPFLERKFQEGMEINN